MPELAVITGASSGIGAVFARKLAACKYDLLLVARREDRLRSLAREIATAHGVSAEPIAADLTNDEDLERVAARIENAPGLGVLVNNAGFGTRGFFQNLDVESQIAMHRLHVIATMRLTHAALKNLVPRATGGVINVSSVAAYFAGPQSTSYNATKAWMNNFTEALFMELRMQGSPVRMEALCPGFTLSEFHDAAKLDRGRIPQSLWMSPDFVVAKALEGFDQGKLFVIPGWRYRLIVRLMSALPGPVIRSLLTRSSAR